MYTGHLYRCLFFSTSLDCFKTHSHTHTIPSYLVVAYCTCMKKGLNAPSLTTMPASRKHWIIFGSILILFFPVVFGFWYIVNATVHLVYQDDPITLREREPLRVKEPFPVGINLRERNITEMPHVEAYLVEELSGVLPETEPAALSLVRKTIAHLALMDWFQNLAAGGARILIIEPGERKEQIAANFGKILKWNDEQEREFLAAVVSADPVAFEGKFVPGSYVTTEGALPTDVAPLIIQRFDETILSRYQTDVASRIPLNDALTVASLLEREAYDFTDMRYIAGVIWNRLFIDMNLQIDATLQYAKGTASTRSWWPTPVPNDKYIDSPYNTYEHSGLPPTPIANPSPEAVLAALNPRNTNCLYYFHDRKGGFHCTETYEEHVAELKKYYGRGK